MRNINSYKWFATAIVYCLFLLYYCHTTPATVHNHSHNPNLEREQDGSFKARDSQHFEDGEHYAEFDHEAILGSVKEAEEFDKLSPTESKRRLGLLLLKMDVSGDGIINRKELKAWILKSFSKLANEEAEERLEEVDENNNGLVSWQEYLQDTYGMDSDLNQVQDQEDSNLMADDKIMFRAADKNEDGELDLDEFAIFINPEEHEEMHPFLMEQTLRDKDADKDGKIDFQEFIGDRGTDQGKEWLISEKDKFDSELDLNQDGYLIGDEIKAWIVPSNDEIADDEVEHLFASSDDDHDLRLSFEEIIKHHDIFVGSEATDFGEHLYGEHVTDEL